MSIKNIIKYQIQKSRSIVGQGSIDNIKNKHINKIFQLYSDQDHSFDVYLRFQAPSIVTKINLRFINTERYEITLIGSKNKVIQEIKKNNIDKDNETVVIPETTQPARYAMIKIIKNPHISEQLGIRYIIFMGINGEVQNKPTFKIKTDDLKDNLKIHDLYPVETKINIRSDRDQKIAEQKNSSVQHNRKIQQNQGTNRRSSGLDDLKSLNFLKKDKKNDSLEKFQKQPRRKIKLNQAPQQFAQFSRESHQRFKNQKQQQKEQTQLAIALSKSVEPIYQYNYRQYQQRIKELQKKLEKLEPEKKEEQKVDEKEEFYNLLIRSGITDITVEILKSEDIRSVQELRQLKDEDLKGLGLKLGEIIRLRKVK